jgi:hypothetical protein
VDPPAVRIWPLVLPGERLRRNARDVVGVDIAMNKPQRIQLRRTKGWTMPDNTVKVDRSTIYGNPFRVESGFSPAQAANQFRRWLAGDALILEQFPDLEERRQKLLKALPKLRGRNLACWCPLPEPGQPDRCHAAALIEIASKPESQQ